MADQVNDKLNDSNSNISDDKPFNYRHLNCQRARYQRSINKIKRQQEENEYNNYLQFQKLKQQKDALINRKTFQYE